MSPAQDRRLDADGIATDGGERDAGDPTGRTDVASDGVPTGNGPATGRAAEGWWRYPPAAWAGLVATVALLAVGSVLVGPDFPGQGSPVMGQLVTLLATTLVAGPVLALVLGSLLSFGTVFWGSLHYENDPSVEWNPSPVLYLGASLLFTPLVGGGAWFLQRVRHVGTPDLGSWI